MMNNFKFAKLVFNATVPLGCFSCSPVMASRCGPEFSGCNFCVSPNGFWHFGLYLSLLSRVAPFLSTCVPASSDQKDCGVGTQEAYFMVQLYGSPIFYYSFSFFCALQNSRARKISAQWTKTGFFWT